MASLSLFSIPFRKLDEMDEIRITKQEKKMRDRIERNNDFIDKYIKKKDLNDSKSQAFNEHKEDTLSTISSTSSNENPINQLAKNKGKQSKNKDSIDLNTPKSNTIDNLSPTHSLWDVSSSKSHNLKKQHITIDESELGQLTLEQKRDLQIMNRLHNRWDRNFNSTLNFKQQQEKNNLEEKELLQKKKDLRIKQRSKDERQKDRQTRHLDKLDKKREERFKELEEKAEIRLEAIMNHVHMEQLKSAMNKGIVKNWKDIALSKRKYSRKQRLALLEQHEQLEMKRLKTFMKLDQLRSIKVNEYYKVMNENIVLNEKKKQEASSLKNSKVTKYYPLKNKYLNPKGIQLEKLKLQEALEEKREVSLLKKRPIVEIKKKKLEISEISSSSDEISEDSQSESDTFNKDVVIQETQPQEPSFISPNKQRIRTWEQVENQRYLNVSNKLKHSNEYILRKLGKISD